MNSTFSWLDHSDQERRRVLEAIDRFKESDTRDELGVGSIRDAFADMFFPGTSVQQTRARYFLFVPWLYIEAERRRIPAAKIAAHVRKAEIALIDPLLASDDPTGTLGRIARSTLKRLPSSVYWLGLGRWNVRLFFGSVDDYHRSIDRFHARPSNLVDDDDELVASANRPNWHAQIPKAPPEFPEQASFRLLAAERQFLTDQVRFGCHGTLLEFLVRRGEPADVDFAWIHPQLGDFPEPMRMALGHARLFAESMQGAALLYNLMLAESLPPGDARDEGVERFREQIDAWCSEMAEQSRALAEWDRRTFWTLVRARGTVKHSTESFVEHWLHQATWSHPKAATDGTVARALIQARERSLKGPRARLGNPRALELWGGESGTARLDFRWRTARRLVADIRGHEAMEEDNNRA
jgi:hypothetical protein